MNNYTKENLIAVPPTSVPAGTLAIKVGNEIFTAGKVTIGGGSSPDVRTLTVTPSKSQQNFTSAELGENAYYGTVTVYPIPDEYITTDDATAEAGDILSGKTAYVNGEKITGVYNPTVYPMPTPAVDGNVVTIFEGYNNTEQTITVGTAKGAATYTPGTSDQTINAGTYLTGNQIIKGSANLISENIKDSVSLFGVDGSFTSDATASAGDLAQGKTAYVRGEKITGTSSVGGGAVVKWWRSTSNSENRLSTFVFSSGKMSVPADTGYYNFAAVDEKLLYHNGNTIKYYADSSIKWKYAVTNSADGNWCEAISDDGKLYYIQYDKRNADGELIATRICENVEGITQVMIRALNDKALVVANGYLYLTQVNYSGRYAQVQYEKKNTDDPTVYVKASNVLNCSQYSNWEDAYVITDDGSLAKVWHDGQGATVGNAYAKIYDNDRANGNPFLNYNPQGIDYAGDSYSKGYELAFRADGLWYREPGWEYKNGVSQPATWNKANDPGLIKTNFLGYCSSYVSEDQIYNEETGEYDWSYSFSESAVALHIDTQGRLWKIAVAGTISGDSYQFTGLSITQIGEDSDWQCVPPSIMSGKTNIFAQKGGKLIRMTSTLKDGKIVLTWKDFPYSPSGRMIANLNNADLFFAPEGVTVDLSKPGGTY